MSVELTTLGEYIKVQGGYAYKSKDFSKSGACPVLKIKNVRFGKIDYSETSFVSEEIASETTNWKTAEGDILISMTGSGPNAPQSLVGRVARVWEGEPEAWINQRVGRIVLKNKNTIHPDFVFYLLSSPKSQEFLVSNSSGSANQANISGKTIESLPCPKISYEESAEIAKTLLGIDQKIIVNTKISNSLEVMAQAIFKSWFVDFEPTRAKIAAKVSGIDPNLAAIAAIAGKKVDELESLPRKMFEKLQSIAEFFPDKFMKSEIGEIPYGWEQKPFGELLSKTIGGDWGKEEPDDKHTEKVRILRGTDLPNVYSGSDDSVPTRFVEPKKLASRRLVEGDIVIEVSGGSPSQPTGRSLYVTQEIIDRLALDIEPASFCRLFRPLDKNIGLILGLHLQRIYGEGKTWLYQNASTGISNFQTKIFLEKEFVVVPPENIKEVFYELVIPYLQKISSSENKTLSELRDTLLPKLLSGELGRVNAD